MWNEDHLTKLLTAVLLTGLMLFFWALTSGCASQAAATAALEAAVDALEPEAPPAPVMEPVRFEDAATKLPSDGGLWISYNDYRALERNIIAMREYETRLLLVIEYYREEKR
jgi:hypothetical protein